MDNITICCFCKKQIDGRGNSTWGCWSPEEEKAGEGEKRRCCDRCNRKIVIANRSANAENTGHYDDTSWRK